MRLRHTAQGCRFGYPSFAGSLDPAATRLHHGRNPLRVEMGN